MRYSNPIRAIFEREYARTEGKNYNGPTRIVAEISQMHGAVEALENVAIHRNPADNDAVHQKKTHEAGVRLAKAIAATKSRANDILNNNNTRLNQELAARTGLGAQTSLDAIMRHQELRAVVRGMDERVRRDVLTEAVKAKDADTLNALLNGGPLLSGIEPKFLATMRESYERAVAPEILEEQAELLNTDEALQAVIRSCETVSKDAQNPEALEAFIRAQQAAESASASFDAALSSDA